MADSTKAASRVLVVEDEYLIRMLLEDMLDDLGYAVAGAASRYAEAIAGGVGASVRGAMTMT